MNVYLIHAEGTTRYKIGITARTIEHRMKELNSSQAAFPLTLITSIRSDDYKAIEKHLHQKYSSNRKYNEWFDFSQGELLGVKEYMQTFNTPLNELKPTLKQKAQPQPLNLALPRVTLPLKNWILPLVLVISFIYVCRNVEFFQPRHQTSNHITIRRK